MKLTLQTDYSLRVLLYLALEPDRIATVGAIAEAYGISAPHLAKVAQLLGRLGYVHLLRGQSGGLRLAVPANEIRIGDVVRSTEPNLVLVECFDPPTDTCPITPACALKGVLAQARDAFFAVLDRHTVADAVAQRARLGVLLGLSPPQQRAR